MNEFKVKILSKEEIRDLLVRTEEYIEYLEKRIEDAGWPSIRELYEPKLERAEALAEDLEKELR